MRLILKDIKMKKCFLIFYLLRVSFSFGQSYTPFPDSNAVWVNGDYGVDWSGEIPEFVLYNATNYCMTNQDTSITGNIYSQLFICGGNYVGALRDNGGQVFYVPKDSTSELLVYDFTVTTGQVLNNVIYTGNFMNYTIGLIDSVLIGGSYRTRIHVGEGYWLEGVGCSMGLFNDPYADLDGMQELMCMSYLDSTFFPNYGLGFCPMDLGLNDHPQNLNELFCFPNPTGGTFFIERNLNVSFESTIVTNNLGQEINPEIIFSDSYLEIDLSKFPNGIYFVTLTNEDGKFTQKIFKQ